MYGTKNYSATPSSYQRCNIKNVELYKRRARLRHLINTFNLHVSKIRNQELYLVVDLRKLESVQIITLDEIEQLIEKLCNGENAKFKE